MIIIGAKAEVVKCITEEEINECAKHTGDYNPIHINEEAAKRSIFGKRVAHGVLAIGLISAILGTKMPGDGTILLAQNVKYTLPIFIGDTIRAVCEVIELINEEKGIYRVSTRCYNQNGDIVLDGDAVIKYK